LRECTSGGGSKSKSLMTEDHKGWAGIGERWQVMLLMAVALLVYANTLGNGFVFDDNYYVFENPAAKTISPADWFRPTSNNVFRPVTFATLALNWVISAGRPLGYHLVNILLHAAVVVLLYLLLQMLLARLPQATTIAFASALLFAVHPIHTEAVAWITGRSELLAAGWLLAAWLFHLRNQQLPALLCFVPALLAKESAVVFLPLVLAGDYALGKFKPFYRYGVIAATTGLYLALLRKMQGGRFGQKGFNSLDNPLGSLPLALRIPNGFRVAWKYIGLQVYPARLSCDYSYNAILLYARWRLLPILAATLLILVMWAWLGKTGRKEWFLAGAIYLAGFAVTANILLPTGTIMGERLAYLPSIGFCLLFALFWVQLGNRYPKAGWVMLGLILVALSVRTMARNRDWHDNFTLYSAAVRAVPGSTKAHALLGQEYLRRGQLDEARAELGAALRIFPDFPEAIENYGLVEVRAGHNLQARNLLEKAYALTKRNDPDYSFRAVNLAAWLIQEGGADSEALQILNQSIAVAPADARAWANRAVVAFRRGDWFSARADAEQALRLDSSNGQARNLLLTLNGAALGSAH
jgi:tetratricopeptide (TPR) repeat protein